MAAAENNQGGNCHVDTDAHSEIPVVACACGRLAALGSGVAAAQTYGFATMQPGTLNHTTGSAIAKVLKEKAGMNVLVQPTAGESS